MSLRLIAGERKGMALQSPPGDATRPTLGRVRESLFMMLQVELPEARTLDLFAGTGALGLEALSRGATHATFVENGREAIKALRANIAKAGWTDRAVVAERDALRWLRQPAAGTEAFGLVFLDPPYGSGLCEQALEAIGAGAAMLLLPGGLVVAQAGRRDALAEQHGALRLEREKPYGETRIALYRLAD